MQNVKQKSNVEGDKMILKLYVCGMSPRSMQAISNIQAICKQYLHKGYDLEIIDIYKNPRMALTQQIVFSPSLIRFWPLPKKTLVGTLADTQKVINGLNIDDR